MKAADLLTLDGGYTIEDCKLAASFSKNWILVLCYVLQLILSFISFTALYYLFRSAEFKRIGRILGKNLKLLAVAGWFVYFTGVFVSTSLYSLTLIDSIRNLNECDYIWEAWRCIGFRFINHYSIVGLGLFHLMMLVERLYSIHQSTDRRTWAGYTFTIGALLLPVPVILFMYRAENLVGVYKVYCFGSKETISIITNVTHAIGILDLFAMVGDLLLFRYNKYLISMKTQNYTLTKSFQLRERELSIRLIIPLSILHTITFFPFVITYLMNQFFSGEERIEYLELAFLIKSLYNAAIPLFIIYLHKRRATNNVEWLQSSEHHTDIYFRQLNQQFQKPT